MEIRVRPYKGDSYPIGGILVKGSAPATWAAEMQRMEISLAVPAYPIPGPVANSVWGCLILLRDKVRTDGMEKNIACQMMGDRIFLPRNSRLLPQVSAEETAQLFSGSGIYLYHPETGWSELTEAICWADYLLLPASSQLTVTAPALSVTLPSGIRSFRIEPVTPEQMLEQMEHRHPQRKPLEEKPLNLLEKGKLQLYRRLFRKGEGAAEEQADIKKGYLLSKLEKLTGMLPGIGAGFADELLADYEQLEQRNQKEIDKLMELFRNNPEEALRYAIPLDDGTARGGNAGQLHLSRRWGNLSLFDNWNTGGPGGRSSVDSESYNRLYAQYNKTAEELIRQGNYRNAAFIYLKLLKNHHLAAQTLEQGGLYAEAAAIYLKYLSNKQKAAECYEKGHMYTQAAGLYTELMQYEKVGDLYLLLNQKQEAHAAYQRVIEEYCGRNQFVKAALIYKYKMQNPSGAQLLLLDGWKNGMDASNCLSNYFANIEEPAHLNREVEQIYYRDTHARNRADFLRIIRHVWNRQEEPSARIREIAYEIIAHEVAKNPAIISELRFFNQQDNMITKDIVRYKNNRRKDKE